MDIFCCLNRWRRWIGFVVIMAYIVILVIALPLCIWELEKENTANHVEAWFVGGIFVMMALPISFWGILQHIINYTQPVLQRHIIRILWMVPIYAVNAWFALRFPSAAIYLDTLRECYEAYVIYNFMAYLLAFLTHEYPHLDVEIENKPPVKHLFPLCFLPPCRNGSKFIQRCKHGVLQYTVVRPAMTVIAVMCEMFGKYKEGDFDFTSAWSYLVLINNASQILAMYCLVLFYKAFKEELQPLKPLPKFLCVKAVVFMSFWQGLFIAVLVKLNVIPQNGTWVFYKNVEEVATGIQDFLICVEMFIAAVAHYYSFSHKPFINLAAEQKNCCESFLSMWNVSDVTEDVVEHARYIGRGVHKRLNREKRNDNETSPLIVGAARDRMYGVNMQNRMTPSPAVVLENEEAQPFEFDNSSIDTQSESFANKSTTMSMNNYAEFSDSANFNSRATSRASVDPRYLSFSDDEKGRGYQRDIRTPGLSEVNRAKSAVGRLIGRDEDVDDKFEEIHEEEAKDEEDDEHSPHPVVVDDREGDIQDGSSASDNSNVLNNDVIPNDDLLDNGLSNSGRIADDQMQRSSDSDLNHNPVV